MGLDGVKLKLVNDIDTAADLLRWASERNVLAVDTETTGLDPDTDHVRLVQVGDAVTGWAIPFRDWGGVFRQLADRFDGEWIMHNAKFDYAMLAGEGVHLPQGRCHDTRLMSHVLEPTMSTALKKLAGRLVDRRAGSLQTALDESLSSKDGWTWATVPIDFEPYWSYACLDTILTFQLHDVLRSRLDSAGAQRAYDLEMAVSWICARMERTGFRVDRAYTDEAAQRFNREASEIVDWCEAEYNCRPTQNASVAAALVAEGVQLDQVTQTGAVKLDKEVLGGIDHPLAVAVLKHRTITKLGRTYLSNYMTMSERDGRLHPRINTVGARTGRMSMDTPNLQNLPRRSESNPEAITVRNCLIPSDGNRLMMADFDQIEMRVMAHLSGDPGLIEAFNSDADFFTVLARNIYQDPQMEKSDGRRQLIKNYSYASAYGAGPSKLAVTAGISVERAYETADQFNRSYPGLKQLMARVEASAIYRRGEEGKAYVRSPLTGRIHPADEDRLYSLTNYLIQGTATELFKMKLVELDAAGLGEYMVIPVHDEIILDVPMDVFDEVGATVLSVMDDPDILSVPITAGLSAGDRWGQKVDHVLD